MFKLIRQTIMAGNGGKNYNLVSRDFSGQKCKGGKRFVHVHHDTSALPQLLLIYLCSSM